MKIKTPKIKITSKFTFGELLPDGEFYNLEITENPKRKIVISNLTIDSCIFKNIDFDLIDLEDVELLDVIFEN